MTVKVKLDIRTLVGEQFYREHFADKEMEKKEIGDKRRMKTVTVKRDDPVQSPSDRDETRKKPCSKVVCKPCGKVLSQFSALYRHKKHHCKARIPILKLEWNGSTWVKSDNRFFYRLQLGRNLYNLIEKGAIKDDVLNCAQRKYVNMYKSLFSE